MNNAGERLKKIRLEKGLSLEEVAKKTKVSLSILRDIEDDTFINLEPVYVKGFIKIYCNFLGVAPSDFISEVREPQVTMKLSDDEEKATPFLHPLPVRKPLIPWRMVLMALAAVAAVFFIAGLMRGCGKNRQHPSAAGAVRAMSSRPAAVAPAPKPKTAAAVVQNQKVPISRNKDEQAGIRLGIHAAEDCWVQVKLDGKTVFATILFRGRTENWIARDKIDLSLGSAGAVELEVNGSRIPSLGRKGQVLKNIVISKDGLKVGK
jgi:cytoskeleton protein RodZ